MTNKPINKKNPFGDVKKKNRKEKTCVDMQKRIYPNPREEFFRDGVEPEHNGQENPGH